MTGTASGTSVQMHVCVPVHACQLFMLLKEAENLCCIAHPACMMYVFILHVDAVITGTRV